MPQVHAQQPVPLRPSPGLPRPLPARPYGTAGLHHCSQSGLCQGCGLGGPQRTAKRDSPVRPGRPSPSLHYLHTRMVSPPRGDGVSPGDSRHAKRQGWLIGDHHHHRRRHHHRHNGRGGRPLPHCSCHPGSHCTGVARGTDRQYHLDADTHADAGAAGAGWCLALWPPVRGCVPRRMVRGRPTGSQGATGPRAPRTTQTGPHHPHHPHHPNSYRHPQHHHGDDDS